MKTEKIIHLQFKSRFRIHGTSLEYDDAEYTYDITADYENSRLVVSIDGIPKTVKIVQKGIFYDYVYQIKKTQVNCQSLEKLMKHFKECINHDVAPTAWCITPLGLIFDNVRPVKV